MSRRLARSDPSTPDETGYQIWPDWRGDTPGTLSPDLVPPPTPGANRRLGWPTSRIDPTKRSTLPDLPSLDRVTSRIDPGPDRAQDSPLRSLSQPRPTVGASPVAAAIQQLLHGGPATPGDSSTHYDTRLSPGDEQAYQAWKAKVAPNDSGQDYDFRGAYHAGVNPDPGSGHWPDTFKKPNEPTFSNESQYAILAPWKAGTWKGDQYQEAPAMKVLRMLGGPK